MEHSRAPRQTTPQPKESLLGRTIVITVVGSAIALVVGFIIIPLIIRWFVGPPDNSLAVDAEHRARAVAVYSQQISDQTKGAIVIRVHDDPRSYVWMGIEKGVVVVDVTVGSCPRVEGYFGSPARPASATEFGPLKITVPSKVRGAPSAEVQVDPSHLEALGSALADSSLSHCIAGDARFQAPH